MARAFRADDALRELDFLLNKINGLDHRRGTGPEGGAGNREMQPKRGINSPAFPVDAVDFFGEWSVAGRRTG